MMFLVSFQKMNLLGAAWAHALSNFETLLRPLNALQTFLLQNITASFYLRSKIC